MAADRYQYLQGREHALSMLTGINSMLGDKGYVEKVLRTLERGCTDKPPSHVEGILSVVKEARLANA